MKEGVAHAIGMWLWHWLPFVVFTRWLLMAEVYGHTSTGPDVAVAMLLMMLKCAYKQLGPCTTPERHGSC